MLSQPVSEQQKQSEMQSVPISEEGSTGFKSAGEETLADNTEDPSVDVLANYCKANGIENPVEIFDCKQKATGCTRCFSKSRG